MVWSRQKELQISALGLAISIQPRLLQSLSVAGAAHLMPTMLVGLLRQMAASTRHSELVVAYPGVWGKRFSMFAGWLQVQATR